MHGYAFDAVVVGAGPNGLAAAITLARAGWSVLVAEGAEDIGGGVRSAELTVPGFLHDTCSAIHPLGVGSPFFRTLPLADFGLEWIHPDAPAAHPLDDGAVFLERRLDHVTRALGPDGAAYAALVGPLAEHWEALAPDLLSPLTWPRHPLAVARFGIAALRPARALALSRFRTPEARALFAGLGAHSLLSLDRLATSAIALVLAASAHAVGWPLPRGGARSISRALASYFCSLGGAIRTGQWIDTLAALPRARAVLLDVSPVQLLRLGGDRLPTRYQATLRRFRYNSGSFKVDWALTRPIPWRDPACARAGTVHVGGTLDEIVASEAAPWQGRTAERPFVLLAQPTLFDDTRAPPDHHIAWAYCHVPNGSGEDMTGRIEAQVERFAPGFRDCILARSVMDPAALERRNPNYVGGDINGGAQDLGQMWFRPTRSLRPYRTPLEGVYICSASTPPGGGVHGMCGYHAARTVLRDYGALPRRRDAVGR
jgi:phytoene dehydrogenase-like protein